MQNGGMPGLRRMQNDLPENSGIRLTFGELYPIIYSKDKKKAVMQYENIWRLHISAGQVECLE